MERRVPRPILALFLCSGALALGTPAEAWGQDTPWPTAGWPTSTLAAEGMRSAPWGSLDSAIRAGRHGNVDHLLVIRHGRQVLRHDYRRDYATIAAGRRTAIGCGPGACAGHQVTPGFNYYDPAEHPYYRGGAPHNLQSTTKSIVATVLGAAVHQGVIASLDEPLLRHLAAYRDVRTDPRLERATLRDLLTMRSGIEWHEQDRPLDSTNTTLLLEGSRDWVRFTLAQPMDADPGTKWAYNSGGSHLISAIIHGATGRDAEAYGREFLFGPLGITDLYWKRGGGGLPDGEGGLYLRPEDLAKIGYLYLHDGVWEGRRLLPAGWARDATARHVELGTSPNGPGYGYQWWRLDRGGEEFWVTRGFGGNYLVIAPRLGIIAVALGWNVFLDPVPDVLGPLLNAILASDSEA
jgi:CubicO group peptidase (beta-lactamase class C family)